MNNRIRVKVSLVAGLACVSLVHAADFVWTGAESASWTNAANWVDAKGAAVTRCPGVVTNADTTALWTAVGSQTDCAVFSNASARAQVDVDGLFAIRTLLFTGACPAHEIGLSTDQILPFTQTGYLTVEQSAANLPVIVATVRAGVGVSKSDNKTYLHLSNSQGGRSTGSLLVFRGGIASATCVNPANPPSWWMCDLYLEGLCGHQFDGVVSPSGVVFPHFNSDGRVRFNASLLGIRNMDISWTPEIEIGANAKLQFNKGTDHEISFINNVNCRIFGDGVFEFVSSTGNPQYLKGINKTLTFECKVAPYSGWSTYAESGLTLSSGSGGLVRFCGANTLNGPLNIYAAALGGDSIGTNKAASCVGGGSIVRLSNGGALAYTGPGEETGRSITIVTNTLKATAKGVLSQRGTGTWKVVSPITIGAGLTAATLGLDNTSGTAAILAAEAPHAGATLALEKTGMGPWTISSALTFDGAVNLTSGSLTLADGGAAALSSAASLAFSGNASLTVAAGVATELPAITVSSGSSSVTVPDGATLTLAAAPAITSGASLDFVTAESARVLCPALAGTIATGITFNGLPAKFRANGELDIEKYPSVDRHIAAHGGVVPDAPGEVVAIDTDGTTGPVTLAADSVAVDTLVQKASADATVELSDQTLSVATLAAQRGAGAFTVGSVVGEGSVTAVANSLTLDATQTNAAFVVNAKLTAADGTTNTLTKTGASTAQVAALSGSWKLALAEKGRLTLGTTADGLSRIEDASIAGASEVALGAGQFDFTRPAANTISGFRVGNKGQGILRVGPGTAATNRLYVGSGGGCGAVYQTGGYFCNYIIPGAGDQYRPGIGFDGYGYYELRDGVYVEGGSTEQMCATWGSTAVLDIYGGTRKNLNSEWFWMNAKPSATGVIVLRGGSYSLGNARFPDAQGSFFFTQEGEDSVASFTVIEMTCVANSTSIFNLNGGVFQANEICRWNNSGSMAVFNFNGGTMKARTSAAYFRLNNSSRSMIHHAVSYDRGATFDTAGYNASLGVPLEAPTGLGVASIAWTADDAAEAYIGAPAIVITGDGFGATAVADFDSASGSVTNIRVACSGSGYTAGNVTAKLKYGSTTRTLPVTLGPVVPGGLIKKGKGTLTLDQANTYAGTTTVLGGTLKAGVADAIPSGATVIVRDGATMDFNGMEATLAKFTYGAGGGACLNADNVTGITNWGLALSTEELLANKPVLFSGDVDLTGRTLEISGDVAALDPNTRAVVVETTGTITGLLTVSPELPAGWSLHARGNKIYLCRSYGLLIITR